MFGGVVLFRQPSLPGGSFKALGMSAEGATAGLTIVMVGLAACGAASYWTITDTGPAAAGDELAATTETRPVVTSPAATAPATTTGTTTAAPRFVQTKTIHEGRTASFFGGNVVVSVLGIAFEGDPLRNRVTATIAEAPGDRTISLQKADVGTVRQFLGEYEVRVVGVDTFTATFVVRRRRQA